MLVINSASGGGVRYWQQEAVASRWLGQGAHALGLEGAVTRDDLVATLAGRAPDGTALTARPGLRRRQGWDLVLAAPKSFSLLAEAGLRLDLPAGPVLVDAYRQAVADTVTTLEGRAAFVVSGGQRRPAPAVVAACFEHLKSDAGQPHFHSHVVLANLGALPVGEPVGGQPAGERRWGCLVGDELWRWREALGAGFHMALRDHLARAGLYFTWELSPGGLGELTEVPATARAAASTRSTEVAASRASFGSVSRAADRVAQGSSRSGTRAVPVERPQWGDDQAAAVLAEAQGRPAPATAAPAVPTVAEALAGRSSTFTEPDVVVALGETAPSGLGLSSAVDWARQWCPPDRGPATTPRSRGVDERIVDLFVEARFARCAQVSPVLAERELAELGTAPGVAEAALGITCGGEGVSIVPSAPWLAQAEVIDAARSVWQAAGMTVEVAAPTEISARRWQALTSLRPPGTPVRAPTGPTGPTGLTGVTGHGRVTSGRALVVDAADHLGPLALADLVDRATRSGTKLVLVAQGTVPGRQRPLSEALEHLAQAYAPPGDWSPARLPGPAWPHGRVDDDSGLLHGALSGPQSIAHLVQAWAQAVTRASSAEAPMMVALGPAEAEALNAAGRQCSPAAGPHVLLGRRWYGEGDQVMALRRLGQVPTATRGVVMGTEEDGVLVRWRRGGDSWTASVGQGQAGSLGYGYATTVPYLRNLGDDVALLALGPPAHLGPRQGQCREAWVTLAGSGLPSFGPGGREARLRAGWEELSSYRARPSPEPQVGRDLTVRRRPPGPALS